MLFLILEKSVNDWLPGGHSIYSCLSSWQLYAIVSIHPCFDSKQLIIKYGTNKILTLKNKTVILKKIYI